jgi:hypothetical protein
MKQATWSYCERSPNVNHCGQSLFCYSAGVSCCPTELAAWGIPTSFDWHDVQSFCYVNVITDGKLCGNELCLGVFSFSVTGTPLLRSKSCTYYHHFPLMFFSCSSSYSFSYCFLLHVLSSSFFHSPVTRLSSVFFRLHSCVWTALIWHCIFPIRRRFHDLLLPTLLTSPFALSLLYT